MIPLSIYKIGVPIGLFVYYLYRLFRIYILKRNMELKFPNLYGLFLGLGMLHIEFPYYDKLRFQWRFIRKQN